MELTEQYYEIKSNQWNKQATPQYVQISSQAIELELKVSEFYFPISQKKYMEIIRQKLIKEKIDEISKNYNNGLKIMLKQKQEQNLINLYEFTDQLKECHQNLAIIYKSYIIEQGSEILKNNKFQKIPIAQIQEILKLMEETFKLERQIFKDTKEYFVAKSQAIEEFINKEQKISINIALYCDYLLRQGFKSKYDNEIEQMIYNIMTLFKFVFSKDLFFQVYEKLLAKRLLTNNTLSDDYENKFFLNLKTNFGNSSVTKIDHQRKDIKNSVDLNKQFQDSLSQKKDQTNILGFKLDIKVLTKCNWPNSLIYEENCSVPKELQQTCQQFREFYEIKFKKNRILYWPLSLGQAELKFKAKYLLVVSIFQLSILLNFNNQDQYTIEDLIQITGISTNTIIKELYGIIKIGILCLQNNEKQIENIKQGDKVVLNRCFDSEKKKIMCMMSKKEGDQSKLKKDIEQLEQNRNNQIDAIIVRIMKARNLLDHDNLIFEVYKGLDTIFKPDIKQIKTRIESLISREYLKREDTNQRLYKYMP